MLGGSACDILEFEVLGEEAVDGSGTVCSTLGYSAWSLRERQLNARDFASEPKECGLTW